MTTKEIIKDLCKKSGISVNKLETTLGFGTGYVSKLDKSSPNMKKIQLIADYFGVSVDYLMTGEEKPDPIRVGKEHAKLLKMYEMLTSDEKEQILNTMKLFLKNK